MKSYYNAYCNTNMWYANNSQQGAAATMWGLKLQGCMPEYAGENDPEWWEYSTTYDGPSNDWNAGKSSWNY